MKKHLYFLAFWLAASQAFAQANKLTVADVRNSFSVYQGTIEQATLSVRPKGLYVECGLYLTFSARGVNFGSFGDSIEVVLNFTLPEGSTLHDSWLWIGDHIVQARIFDRWSATNIYEGIVKRRQDPSILVKNSATDYQLRVFPMVKTGTRRVKITWLQPADLRKNLTEMTLPFHILKTSKNVVSKLNLHFWPDERFKNPVIPNHSEIKFEEVNHPQLGAHSEASLPSSLYVEAPALQLTSPLQNGYYLSTQTEGDENFYQLALLPGYFVPQGNGQKVAILVDYEKKSSALSTDVVLKTLQTALLANLNPADSFNLFFSNLVIGKAANRWLPAHPDTIQKVFASFSKPLSDYSNLQSLLVTGIQWAQQHGPDATILVVSNSVHLGSFQAANPLLNDITALNHPTVPIHTINYNQETTPYIYLNNTYYYANSYFLYNLAGLNDGTYQQTLNTQTLAGALTKSFANLEKALQSFDLHTSVSNGFCYGRFLLGSGSRSPRIDQPVLQIGKFKGNAPFRVEMNGLLDDQLIHTEFEIPASEIKADSLIREMWYGRYVQILESEAQTNNTIGEIIFNSLNQRVLSKYSAFLCLELPEWICPDCVDETQTTSTDDPAARDSMLTASPNPFSDYTTIVVQVPSKTTTSRAALEIFSTDGRLVQLFDLSLQNGGCRTVWNGTNTSGQPVPAGIYICMLKLNGQTRVMKLVKT